MRGIVVVDAHAPGPERAAAQDRKGVAFQDGVAGEAVPAKIRFEQRPVAVVQREVVDADEVARVPQHRRDQAEPLERAHLDVALARAEERRGQVQEGEIVLPGEPAHVGQDRREAPVPRVLRRG